MKSKVRILLFYTHKETLGHTTRVISLAQALINYYKNNASLLILQGGATQPYIEHPNNCHILNIPFPFDSKESFHSQAKSHHTAERAHTILKTAQSFKPDVFITEFFPFGRSAYTSELLPTLLHLRKTHCRILASIGYPWIIDLNRLQEKKSQALYKGLLSLYNNFLIHTPPHLENAYFHQSIKDKTIASLYTNTLKSINKKIIYTGYILPLQTIKKQPLPDFNNLPPAQHTIFVSRGGGTVYPKVITAAIQSQKILGKDFRTIIVCGPSTSTKEMALFTQCLKKNQDTNTHLIHHLPNLNDYLQQCSVSVSLSGYNTSVQLMFYGTPAIIIPYQGGTKPAPTNDQIARAELLKEKFNSIVLPYTTLTPQLLAQAIHKSVQQPRPSPGPKTWFNGANISAKEIAAKGN